MKNLTSNSKLKFNKNTVVSFDSVNEFRNIQTITLDYKTVTSITITLH